MSCSKLTKASCTSYQEAVKLDSAIKHASACTNSNKKLLFEFNFRFPEDGLALRAVRLVDGVPELLFEAKPKVPTITEEDVATIFRLVAEGKRPCFYYTGLPITNPLHASRLYMLYDPQWLRWTSVGKLLADVDWIMKCIHVGTRSNEDKTVFKAWEKESNLSGPIGTRMDFPKDSGRSGPTIMSCDSATVEKDENELRFPLEPKMKITDGCSLLYSKYATDIYDSVGYYDEPRYLKMQEIVKLVLAVEWLYKEKGVRVSEEWVMSHTSKPADPLKVKAIEAADHAVHNRLRESKKPPYDMIPQPTTFERPNSNVAVKTWEAEAYNFLQQDSGVERRYGYLDFGDAEMLMFKGDGTPCPPQKCLKLGFEHQLVMEGLPPGLKFTIWMYSFFADKTPAAALTEVRERLEKELPEKGCEEVTIPMPMSIDTKVEDSSDDGGVEIKVTHMYRPCAPLALPQMKIITTTKATVDNYSMLYGSEDPNEPIGIFGEDGEVTIPDVDSWEELISDMTVPIPRTWQAPYVGIGEPSSWGGVTTNNFHVREERPRPRMKEEREMQEKDNFRRYGPILGVRADYIVAQGSIQLLTQYSDEFIQVSRKFTGAWDLRKGTCPTAKFIFAITNNTLKQKWQAYGRTVQVKYVEELYHGTTLACNIATTCKLCKQGSCGICGISSTGLDPQCISRDSFQRFGAGFYLAPNSSKCNDYVRGCNGRKAMLLCDVYPGRKYTIQRNRQHLTGPPPGYDSVYGNVGEDLNYPELVVYKPEAVMPRYIIVY